MKDLIKKNSIWILISLLITCVIGAGALRRIDKWAQDILFQQRGTTSSDIVIIGIDEDAFAELGPYNKWDRTVIASALEALASDPDKKPAVTAIDILYAGETSPDADERLAKAAKELGNVITASVANFGEEITFEGGRAVSIDPAAILSIEDPYGALEENSVQGHINAMLDKDGILRHALLYVEKDDTRLYSMAYETARLFLESKGEMLKAPKTRSGHFYVPYTGEPGDYSDGVSIAWLINGDIPADYWAGKIVLIGPYAPALQDSYFTSIDKGVPMYGVEYQANVIQCLLESNYKNDVSDLLQAVVLFFICLCSVFLYLKVSVSNGGIACAIISVLSIFCSILLYSLGLVTHPLWVPASVFVLYILSLAYHYLLASMARRALELEKERIEAELSLATRIQTSSLPKEFPPFPDRKEFDIYASMTPAKEVGGDLYDFFLIDDDHLCLVIGDVSGKGVPASLFMMTSLGLLHYIARHETSPGKILETFNNEICSREHEDMFVTVWLGILEISTGKLTTANAGHEFPVYKPADGSFDLVKDKHGFVVGGMTGIRYREHELFLGPGSKFFVYTDGVPEAVNVKDELFGTERMVEALREHENETPKDILDGISKAVNEYAGEAPQFDDLTMLCIQYNGPKEK